MQPSNQALLARIASIAINFNARVTHTDQLFSEISLCKFCHAPIEPQYIYCLPCRNHINATDFQKSLVLVAPYSFAPTAGCAINPSNQWYYDLKHYKTGFSQESAIRLAILLKFLGHHIPCINNLCNGIDYIAVVPSKRSTQDYLARLVQAMISELPYLPIRFQGDDWKWREPNQGFFSTDRIVTGKNILLIDDSWVTGSSMVSAAYDLKSLGANTVIGVPLARVLRTDWKANQDYFAEWQNQNLPVTFDPRVCPITGDYCNTLEPF